MENRIKTIMRTGIIGIIVNILLAVFKMILGSLAKSISVLMDGVNNLADAGSSLITMIGTALAGKSADRKHPFGYGRVEYLTSLVISCLILYAGVTSLVEAIKSIIHPEASEYSTVALIAIAVAIVVILALALYTQRQGKKANSDSLVASGKEAILDVFVSIATLVAALVYLLLGLALEAYLAAIISIIIIRTGTELLMETVSKLIGESGDVQLVLDIKKTVSEIPGVKGTYDVILNNYGPDTHNASLHVEVLDTTTAHEMDALSREITALISEKYSVHVTAVGFYARNTMNNDLRAVEVELKTLALRQPHIKGIHGFYIDPLKKLIQFDLVVSFDAKDRAEAFANALKMIRAAYPDYTVSAAMDADLNEVK